MPEHVFTGHSGHDYPATRDAANLHLGHVEPGDIRDLPEPPDHMWREATDEDRAALADRLERERFASDAARLKAEGLTGEEIAQDIAQALAAPAQDGSEEEGAEPAAGTASPRTSKARAPKPDQSATTPDSGTKEA